jgi:hypothetical protein
MQKELEQLPETLKELDPEQRLNILCKLMPYVLPKIESIKHTLGESERDKKIGINKVKKKCIFVYINKYNMKIKLILALLISTICNAQITLNEMKSIIKMDIDNFETFAMNKGFLFSNFCDDKFDDECVNYTKGVGEKTKYITLYTKYNNIYKKKVTYQTSIENEYLLFKKQMKEQGFSLFDKAEWQEKGVLFKYYKNKNYKLTLAIGKNEINSVDYEITLEFIE